MPDCNTAAKEYFLQKIALNCFGSAAGVNAGIKAKS